MNRIIVKSVLFAAVAFFAASCVKQEPIDINHETLEGKNPALYEQYMAAVRDYRASNHKILIARFDNKATAPVSLADHLTAMPDSIDYFVLNNAEISESLQSEIVKVRELRAQKTLFSIDFAPIAKEYKELVAAAAEAGEPFTTTLAEYTADAVADCLDQFSYSGLDGIFVSFDGKETVSMTADELEEAKAIQNAYFAPIMQRIASTGKLLFFNGNVRALCTEENVLEIAKYIIVPAESVTSALSMNFVFQKIQGTGVPTDKFIVGVTAKDVTDEKAVDGDFADASSAIVGAAKWVVTTGESYEKLGVCVNHAQFDYFHIGADYCEIKAAISTMNPSPLK